MRFRITVRGLGTIKMRTYKGNRRGPACMWIDQDSGLDRSVI